MYESGLKSSYDVVIFNVDDFYKEWNQRIATKLEEICEPKSLCWQKSLVVRVFANGPEDRCSIPGRVIPTTLKMVLDTSLLNTQQYKVRIKGKVEQSRERSSALLYTSM